MFGVTVHHYISKSGVRFSQEGNISHYIGSGDQTQEIRQECRVKRFFYLIYIGDYLILFGCSHIYIRSTTCLIRLYNRITKYHLFFKMEGYYQNIQNFQTYNFRRSLCQVEKRWNIPWIFNQETTQCSNLSESKVQES